MKISTNSRRWGRILIYFAYFGILFSLFGIATTWYFRVGIEKAVNRVMDSLDQILINTNDGLIFIDSTLDVASGNLEIISETLDTLIITFDKISGSLDASADLIGGDLRETILDTQVAVTSASQSAGLVDNTLRFISAIPLLGADYRPDVPLGISLAQISESLTDVPESFLGIEHFIRETEGSMGNLQSDITALSKDIQNFDGTLKKSQALLAEYELIFSDLQEQFLEIRKNTSTFLLVASIIITGGFFLLGIAQVNVYYQGKTLRDGEKVSLTLSELTQKQNE